MIFYGPSEILNMAIMTKTPHIIVEGVDDLKIYESLASSVGVNSQVYCPAYIDGYTSGNDGVIEIIREINNITSSVDKERYVLGVIDRDAKFYRGEIPNLPCLLCLKYYSIENHFISDEVVRPIICSIGRLPNGHPLDASAILREVHVGVSRIYYLALEALLGAVDEAYNADITFSGKYGSHNNPVLMEKLKLKKNLLDTFAESLGLNSSFESMKVFVKGKWLVAIFSEYLFKVFSELTDKCKSGDMVRCSSCDVDLKNPCLYKINDGFNHKAILSLLRNIISIGDLDYIKAKILAMNCA